MARINLTIFLSSVIIGGGLYFCFRDTPLQTKVIFEEEVRPGKERLFVPVRAEIADSLFTALTGGDKKTAREEDGLFMVRHPKLGKKLSETGMGEALWKELKDVDDRLYRSSNGNELHMSMSKDKASKENIVWVPAGLMSLFVR